MRKSKGRQVECRTAKVCFRVMPRQGWHPVKPRADESVLPLLFGFGIPIFWCNVIVAGIMNNCKEFLLDDLMAVTAIPIANISASDATSPVNILTPTIAKAGFSPLLTGAIVIGLQPATIGGPLVPIRKHTGKTKDDESSSVAGRLHTVTVNCEADDRDISKDTANKTVLDYLLALERTPHHLLLTFRDGITQAFVSATADTYQCNVERDGSKVSVAFRIQNLMGIQLLV